MSWRARVPAAAVLALALATAASAAAEAAVDAHGSAEQVYVTGLAPGAQVALLDADGRTVKTQAGRRARAALLFRDVKPGDGLPRARRRQRRAVGAADGAHRAARRRRARTSTTRTIPSERLRLPDDARRHEARVSTSTRRRTSRTRPARPSRRCPPRRRGPTPTLIEYSGYGYADPAGPQSGIAILANLMGFTVVDVNMRGTGCSGGAFDFFEPLQSLDGYDVDRDDRAPAVGRRTTRSG